MPEKKKDVFIFNYKYAPDFKEVYVNGARGGLMNGYHLRIDFYIEKLLLPFTRERLEIYEDGSRQKKPEDMKEEKIIEREFKVGLMMPFHAVKELTKWLAERLPQIAEVEKKQLESPVLEIEVEKKDD